MHYQSLKIPPGIICLKRDKKYEVNLNLASFQ